MWEIKLPVVQLMLGQHETETRNGRYFGLTLQRIGSLPLGYFRLRWFGLRRHRTAPPPAPWDDPPPPQVPVAVKICPVCTRPYTLDKWRKLELVAERSVGAEPVTVEVRRCHCGRQLELDVEGLENLNLDLPVSLYTSMYVEGRRTP